MKLKSILRLLGFAAAFSTTAQSTNNVDSTLSIVKGTTKSPLTKKQQQSRDKSKRAKQARKVNRK